MSLSVSTWRKPVDDRMAFRFRKYMFSILSFFALSAVVFVFHNSAVDPINHLSEVVRQNSVLSIDNPTEEREKISSSEFVAPSRPIQEQVAFVNTVVENNQIISQKSYNDDVTLNDGGSSIEYDNTEEEKEEALEQADQNQKVQEVATPKKQILLVANFRTGSSLLGDILQSAPDVFYSYEPLWFLERNHGKKTELLRSIFYCQFPGDYLKYINGVSEEGDVNFMMRNRRVWQACRHNKTLCYQPDFIDDLCSTYPIKLIKVIRLRVKELAQLLKEDPNTKDWKIIYLMRDPRGTMASRDKFDWCNLHSICGNATRLCQDTMEDLDWIERLKIKNPENHYLLKFEDLIVNMDAEIQKLFDFFEIPLFNSVRQFIANLTSYDSNLVEENSDRTQEADEVSVKKDLKTIAFAWRSKLSKQRISKITKLCKPVLKQLEYEF